MCIFQSEQENNTPIICNTCSSRLLAAFNLKTTCRDTSNYEALGGLFHSIVKSEFKSDDSLNGEEKITNISDCEVSGGPLPFSTEKVEIKSEDCLSLEKKIENISDYVPGNPFHINTGEIELKSEESYM